jgi:threonine synthase
LEYSPERGVRLESIRRFRKTFPISSRDEFVSLGEGNTPLVSHAIDGKEIFFKCEYLNPTGSFKDRGSSVLVSALVARGIERAADDSSGNAGASFAAYAARAGIDAEIYIPSYASGPKREQMQAYGAEIVAISGPRSAASDAILAAVADGVTYASHAFLPHGIAGMATTAFEIVEQLGRAPGSVIVPVGQGTMIIGLGRGFAALIDAGVIDKLPRLVAVQARACAPIWKLLSGKAASLEQVSEGETIAEGIRIKSPLRAEAIIDQIEKSNGIAVAVEETEILAGRDALGRLGLYIEPTSSVVWPALNNALEELDEPIVLILTGSGLKSSNRQ